MKSIYTGKLSEKIILLLPIAQKKKDKQKKQKKKTIKKKYTHTNDRQNNGI